MKKSKKIENTYYEDYLININSPCDANINCKKTKCNKCKYFKAIKK